MSTVVPISKTTETSATTGAAAPAAATSTPRAPGVPTSRPVGDTPTSALLGTEVSTALAGLHALDPKAVVSRDRYTHAATFVSGQFAVTPDSRLLHTPDAVAHTWLDQNATLVGANGDGTQLQLVSQDRDSLGMEHDKYQQTFRGLPVFGQQIVVHSKGDTVTSAAGRLTPNLDLGTTAALSAQDAFSKVQSTLAPSLNKAQLSLANATLGIYTSTTGRSYLAYQVDATTGADTPEFGSWRYLVDANTGRTLMHYSTVETALNRSTFDAKNGESIPTKPVRTEGQAPVADATVNEAHDNAKSVYDFYQQRFGRDSIDGKGMPINSVVHWDKNYNNAYWDGSKMTYGDGDGKMFTDFAKGLDVVGHEMTHGVTENTAGLAYYKQSGALNESWSDVMGELIQRWQFTKDHPGAPDPDPNYLMGEDIFTPGTPGDGLRSMKDPGHAYAGDTQPGTMAGYKNTSSDNGGVHTNSGIPNHAAYLITAKIGDDKLADIWYRAQTTYLTPNASFQDAANTTVQAATDLYGADSAEVAAVRDAWTQVGVKPKA